MKRLDNRGWTLIEAVLASALLGYLVYIGTSFNHNQITFEGIIQQKNRILALTEFSLSHLESDLVGDIPDVGWCQVITYSRAKELISSVSVITGSGNCKKPTVSELDNKIRILWKVTEPRNNASITFSHPNFLKLPVYTSVIREVLVESYGIVADKVDMESATIYKK